jgi:hypothetical protein
MDQMFDDRVIVLVEELEWISPMVLQPKKTRGIRICVDMHNLNATCMHDPFSIPFTNEVLENVGVDEVLSFTNGFS